LQNKYKDENSIKILRGGFIMDWRVLIVLLPVILAGSWALYNIGQLALKQAQAFINRS
jgi:photosystem II PsbY protein